MDLHSTQPKNTADQPLLLCIDFQAMNDRKRQAQNEDVEGNISCNADDVEDLPVDRGAFALPVAANRLVLKKCYEEEGDDPGEKNKKRAVDPASEALGFKDFLIEEEDGDFDRPYCKDVEELSYEKNLVARLITRIGRFLVVHQCLKYLHEPNLKLGSEL